MNEARASHEDFVGEDCVSPGARKVPVMPLRRKCPALDLPAASTFLQRGVSDTERRLHRSASARSLHQTTERPLAFPALWPVPWNARHAVGIFRLIARGATRQTQRDPKQNCEQSQAHGVNPTTEGEAARTEKALPVHCLLRERRLRVPRRAPCRRPCR